MPRPVLLATISVLLLATQLLSGQSSGWVETIRTTTPAVVTIVTDKALGSGFLVDSKGIIATNNHVIAGAREIEVKMSNGEIYKGADVLLADADRDLALIKVAAVDLPFLNLGNSDQISLGEDVLLISAPVGLENTVSTGVISGIRLREGTKIIQTTVPASHGSSGGPLVNRNGDVIGLMTFLIEGGQNLNFAVSINYLRGMLQSVPSTAANRLAPLHDQNPASQSRSAAPVEPQKARQQAIADAKSIFVYVRSGSPVLEAEISKKIVSWGHLDVVARPDLADLMLEVVQTGELNLGTGAGNQAAAVLRDRSGLQLWSTAKGGSWAVSGWSNAWVGRSIASELIKFLSSATKPKL